MCAVPHRSATRETPRMGGWDDLLAGRYDAPWRCARSPGREPGSTIPAGTWPPGGPASPALARSADGDAAMTRKRPKTQRVKPTPAAPGVKPDTGAHRRLVHGFLVNCGAPSAAPIAAEISGVPALAAILARTPRWTVRAASERRTARRSIDRRPNARCLDRRTLVTAPVPPPGGARRNARDRDPPRTHRPRSRKRRPQRRRRTCGCPWTPAAPRCRRWP